MKDSGIEWIGNIPVDWNVIRNNGIFRERKEKYSMDDCDYELLAVSEYYGVAKKKDKISDGEYLTRAESLDDYRICRKNDLAMNIMLAWKQAYGISDYEGIISPSYAVFEPFDIHPKYYHYLFRTDLYSGLFRNNSTGIIDSRLRLYPRVFLTLYSHHPPIEEQQCIVKYLDEKVSQIDTIINKTKVSIEEYKRYKQSFITETITKGIDPAVTMKNSGIDWLPRIPKSWNKTKLKNICRMKSGDNLISVEIDSTGEYAVYGGNGIRGYYPEYNRDGTYVLIGRQGALCGNVKFVEGKFWATEHALVTEFTNACNPKYFLLLLQTMNLNQYSLSSAQPGLAANQILNLQVCLPDLQEQQEIADYTLKRLDSIDKLLEQKTALITELESYKKSLIYEVVTGKKEVK